MSGIQGLTWTTSYMAGIPRISLTVSILEDDANTISPRHFIIVYNPQWLHLGFHKSAKIHTVEKNTVTQIIEAKEDPDHVFIIIITTT